MQSKTKYPFKKASTILWKIQIYIMDELCILSVQKEEILKKTTVKVQMAGKRSVKREEYMHISSKNHVPIFHKN